LYRQSSSDSVNDANNDDSEYVLSFLADIRVEKFDTGARRSPSVVIHRNRDSACSYCRILLNSEWTSALLYE